MPKTLAQANRKLVWVPSGGILNVSAPKVTSELGAGGVLDISCLVTKNNYSLGPTGDNAISDPALCAFGDSQVPGITSYQATMDFFRWSDVPSDKGWTTFTIKGIDGFLVERIGALKTYATAFAVGDKVRTFGVLTSTPMMLDPDPGGGFEKFRQVFMVQAELVDERAVVASG
jgi:hypothetical protein